jgi:hypothetical protein
MLSELEHYRLRPADADHRCEYAVAFPHFIEVCGNVAWYWAGDLTPRIDENPTEYLASEVGPLCKRHFGEFLKDGNPDAARVAGAGPISQHRKLDDRSPW